VGIFDFDKFALKDIWGQIKDNPERLLVGAIDPWSTKAWNSALGKDWEPMIDQMGGPYGGHTVSAFGNQDGGVYKRAADAGIDTKKGGQMHDIAHIVSAFYGGQGIMGLGGGAPASSGGNLGIFANGGQAGMTGVGGGNMGALASSGGISGGAGGGLGSMQPYMQAMQQMIPQQQQQPQAAPPARVGTQAPPASYLPEAASQQAISKTSQALQEELQRRRIMELFA
jgi:hypothetical protein